MIRHQFSGTPARVRLPTSVNSNPPRPHFRLASRGQIENLKNQKGGAPRKLNRQFYMIAVNEVSDVNGYASVIVAPAVIQHCGTAAPLHWPPACTIQRGLGSLCMGVIGAGVIGGSGSGKKRFEWCNRNGRRSVALTQRTARAFGGNDVGRHAGRCIARVGRPAVIHLTVWSVIGNEPPVRAPSS